MPPPERPKLWVLGFHLGSRPLPRRKDRVARVRDPARFLWRRDEHAIEKGADAGGNVDRESDAVTRGVIEFLAGGHAVCCPAYVFLVSDRQRW